MKKYYIEQVSLEHINPYLSIKFEESVDNELIRSWLNSLDCVDHCNVKEDDNLKVKALVYPMKNRNLKDVAENVDACLTKLLQHM